MSYAGGLEVSMAARAAYESIGKTTHRAGVRGQKPNGNRTREMIWEASGLGACGRPEGSRRGPQRAGGGDSGHLTPGVDAWEPGRAPEQSAASVAWHREHMLPVGAVSSQTWRGRDDAGRTAVLREVPEGQSPVVSTSVFPGIVPLREVTVIDGRRYGVWAFVEAESLQDACERLAELGRTVPLAVLVRVVVDASRALVSVTPGRPHGGLSASRKVSSWPGSECFGFRRRRTCPRRRCGRTLWSPGASPT